MPTKPKRIKIKPEYRKPVREAKTVFMNFRCRVEVANTIKEIAEAEGVTKTEIIHEAIEFWMKHCTEAND